MLYVGNIIEILSDGSSWLFDELVEFQFESWSKQYCLLLLAHFEPRLNCYFEKQSIRFYYRTTAHGFHAFSYTVSIKWVIIKVHLCTRLGLFFIPTARQDNFGVPHTELSSHRAKFCANIFTFNSTVCKKSRWLCKSGHF